MCKKGTDSDKPLRPHARTSADDLDMKNRCTPKTLSFRTSFDHVQAAPTAPRVRTNGITGSSNIKLKEYSYLCSLPFFAVERSPEPLPPNSPWNETRGRDKVDVEVHDICAVRSENRDNSKRATMRHAEAGMTQCSVRRAGVISEDTDEPVPPSAMSLIAARARIGREVVAN